MKKTPAYQIHRLEEPLMIDGRWDKMPWQTTELLNIGHFMWTEPEFKPVAQAKMRYDDANLYGIFRVEDCYVRCRVRDYNGPVYEDSCVEFFFSPDEDCPERYFNLEINAIGIPLMRYNRIPRKETTLVEVEELKKIQIASSLPTDIPNSENNIPLIWTIEYKIPMTLLEKMVRITRPEKGVVWRGNFFKLTSGFNTHYASWAAIDAEKPDFHRPEFFGVLEFH